MRTLAPLALVTFASCHAARAAAPPHRSLPAETVAAPAPTPAVLPVAPPAPPAPLPAWGERFARRCHGYLRPLAVSPSAARVAFCDQLFDDLGHYVNTPEAPLAAVLDDGTSLQLRDDGLVAVSADGRVRARIAARHVDAQGDRVALGPDARTAAWLRRDGTVLVFAVADLRVTARLEAPAGCDTIAFAHDGTLLAARVEPPDASLARRQGERWEPLALPEGTQSVALTDGGRVALALRRDPRVTVLALPTGATLGERTLPRGAESIFPTGDEPVVRPSPDGAYAATCDASGLVLHALSGEARAVTLRATCPGWPRFSIDGRTLVTGDFGMTFLRAGEPARPPSGDRPLAYEVPSVPADFARLVPSASRDEEGLALEGDAERARSWAVPEGFVRAWSHRTSGAVLWVTRRDGAELALHQPLASWARAAVEVYAGHGVAGATGFAARAWTLADGARALEATWRTGGCDPSTQTLRVQERDGAIAVVRLEDWSSPRLRGAWWAAFVPPVLGAAPADAIAVPSGGASR